MPYTTFDNISTLLAGELDLIEKGELGTLKKI